MASGRHPSSVFLIVLLALALSAVLSATSCAVTSEQEAAITEWSAPNTAPIGQAEAEENPSYADRASSWQDTMIDWDIPNVDTAPSGPVNPSHSMASAGSGGSASTPVVVLYYHAVDDKIDGLEELFVSPAEFESR